MMSSQKFYTHQLPNGITILGEPMEFVNSAAFAILIPTGAATDPVGKEGSACLLSEMFHKGAGSWNSRELSEQFDILGIHRSHSAGIEVSLVSATGLGEKIEKALHLMSTVLLEPHFPVEELESVRQLMLQELKSLEDEPASKVMVELSKHFYPFPFGRSQLGTVAGIEAVTIESLRNYYNEYYVSDQVIIAIAGKFDWEKIKQSVSRCFGSWQGKRKVLTSGTLSSQSSVHHVAKDTNQLQIALAYPGVPYNHRDYYVAKVAISILSGGMAGRLFIEVREKRGLVYRVSASHSGTIGRAAVFCYAGTTPENGQKTLEVMIEQLRGLKNGVGEEELNRAKADLKSKIIMQAEFSAVRASSLVNDWWNLSRLRTLEEMKAAIGAVTEEDIIRHSEEFPVRPITLVTLGPRSLELPE